MKKEIVVVFLSLAFTACSSKSIQKSLGSYRLEKDKVKKVRTVAIVAYDLLEYVPEGLAGKVSGMANQAQAIANAKSVESELAMSSYNNMVRAFENNGIKVIALKRVTGNRYYRSLYQRKNKGYDKLPNSFHRPNHIKGLMRASNVTYLLKPNERDQLIDELQVDAVVGLRVSMFTKLKGAFGVGSTYLTSALQFHMYTQGEKKAIWLDLQYEGPRSDKSLGFMSGMADIKEVARQTPPLAGKTVSLFLKTIK